MVREENFEWPKNEFERSYGSGSLMMMIIIITITIFITIVVLVLMLVISGVDPTCPPHSSLPLPLLISSFSIKLASYP